MKKPFTLTIKQPCDQSWEEMQPGTSGRFCGACQKHVVDFTAFSDAQFISYFQNYPKPSDLCGKLTEKQLSVKIPPKPAPVTFWNVNKFAAASLVAALGFTYKADAQINDTTHSSSIFERKSDSILYEKLMVIKGTVQDEYSEGIQGALLSIKGTNISTASNNYGGFELELPQQEATYILICQSANKVTRELTLHNPCDVNIMMENIQEETAESVVYGGIRSEIPKPSLWQRFAKFFRRK